MNKALAIVLLTLTACGQPQDGEVIYVYESVMEVTWESGFQTSHYMHGPGSTAFMPDSTWRYVLQGASSNAIEFYFQYPMQHARHVNWRTVWIPQHTEMRLVASYRIPGVPCPCEQIVITDITPFDNHGDPNMQDISHPLDAPRPVDVDVTEAFNAAIDTGRQTQFTWQVKTL